ncbi:alcohol dehydrogenase [Motilibacter rhizosphaerae]|uniref:Alcohol dehydrogenase n=1 Tax=Motilibacter rhizosphaerae TaxID=598652 RepID=A0A4Q7NAS5_9ACTN|nr:zinc-binding dehydrogenase [Motilibacter rhizosphaerae]RZS79462.1 alcohol dehydrogenase [Motilibacter rhizosphaerae]
MRAWRLEAPGGALELQDVAQPSAGPGAVLVRVEASPLLAYLGDYVSGRLTTYRPPPGPFTPGTSAVGTVEAVGQGVLTLRPGRRVLTTPYVVAAETAPEPPEALVALTAEPGSEGLLELWADGTLAEYAVAPAATVTAVPSGLDAVPSASLAAVSRLVVPYGALLRGRLAAGETVVVHGATGAFGSAGVLVALAMGAARVVAAGRNREVLDRLGTLDRVRAVPMTGDVAADAAALREAAGGVVDLALDSAGRASSADGVLAALAALRRGGRLVLSGSMTVPLPLDYAGLLRGGKEVLGSFMHPPDAPARLLQLVAAGLLDLAAVPVETRPLADLPAAMARAAEPGAPLVVVEPLRA